MILATTTGDLCRYFTTDAETITALHRAGFRHIDLSLYDMTGLSHPYMQDDWKEKIRSLKETADALGMDFVQSHAPSANPLEFNAQWEVSVAVTCRALEICQVLGIPMSVYHSGWSMELPYAMAGAGEKYAEENMKFIRRIIPTMEKTGVMLLIENSTHANMGECYFFYTGKEMKDFLQYANHPLLGACWDTGHANIEGHQYDDILALGDDLRALHFNDNGGARDEHIMPYLGTMSVDAVMCGLRDIGYRGPFTLEATSSLRSYNEWTGPRRPWNEKIAAEADTATAEALERTLYVCASSILTRYGYSVE